MTLHSMQEAGFSGSVDSENNTGVSGTYVFPSNVESVVSSLRRADFQDVNTMRGRLCETHLFFG